jgi:hypothetical protein
LFSFTSGLGRSEAADNTAYSAGAAVGVTRSDVTCITLIRSADQAAG